MQAVTNEFVYPGGMEIIFHYRCPHCTTNVRVPPTDKSITITCPHCHGRFPIVPVDDATVKFIQVITLNGAAAAQQNYL